MVAMGLLLGIVGTDVNTGVQRFSFGITELTDGIGFIVVAVGVFAVGEIVANLGDPEERSVFTGKVKGLMPTWADFKESPAPIARGTLLGSFFGVLPGTGPAIASFSSYMVEKKLAQRPLALRQGRHRRRGRPGIRQQRRRAVQVHPDADARHAGVARDGADARRADHPGHPARPGGDDPRARSCSGA